jgi:hypothetical protein
VVIGYGPGANVEGCIEASFNVLRIGLKDSISFSIDFYAPVSGICIG